MPAQHGSPAEARQTVNAQVHRGPRAHMPAKASFQMTCPDNGIHQTLLPEEGVNNGFVIIHGHDGDDVLVVELE